MPLITKIVQQQKKTDWCSVFVDGKYSFSLPMTDVADFKLKLNQQLTTGELENLKKKSQNQKLYLAVINKLARRPHSTFEISDYLRRKQADEDLIEQVIKKLTKRGYLNDKDFAELWVRSRRQTKSRSTRQLKNELYKKRIDPGIIDEVLEDSVSDELSSLKIMIDKKRRIKRYQDDKKLISYLLGKGFNYSDIKKLID